MNSRLRSLTRKLGLGDSIKFYGHLNDAAILMDRLDVFIMASESAGLPRVLMEAMSVGITCVAPDTGGIPELIENDSTGYLFDSSSYGDMAAKLEDVVIGGRFLDAEKIRKRIEDDFNAEKGSGKTQELYEDMISGERLRKKAYGG